MRLEALQFSKKSPVDVIVEFRTTENPKKFVKKYNIIHNNDGSIYDLDLKKTFKCMYNWAEAITL